MELTRYHLKKLQRQLHKSSECGSVSKLSEYRINLLLIHSDEIPEISNSDESSLHESDEMDANLSSSALNFENSSLDGEVNYDTILNIDQRLLNNVKVHVKDEDGLSKVFDPEDLSLLCGPTKGLEFKKPEVSNNNKILKELDSNIEIPINKSRIPILNKSHSKLLHHMKIRPSSAHDSQKKLSVKKKRPQSQIDLRFPKLDQLIQKLAEQRSL